MKQWQMQGNNGIFVSYSKEAAAMNNDIKKYKIKADLIASSDLKDEEALTDTTDSISFLHPISDRDILAVKSEARKIHSNYYRETHAIELLFNTVRTNDPENFLTISMFTPDRYHTTSMSFRTYMSAIGERGLHQHEYYELIYVIEGEMYQKIESVYHVYPAGSLCLLNMGIRHAEEFTTDFRAAFLSIPQKLADELMNEIDSSFFSTEKRFRETDIYKLFGNTGHLGRDLKYLDFIPVEGSAEGPAYIHNDFDLITKYFMSPVPGASIHIKSHLLEMFCILSDPEYYRSIPVSIGTSKENGIFNEITELLSNSNGHMSRSELEAATNYSGTYLNLICKKYTGLNLFGYGMQICMKEAARLLKETDMKVGDIAEQLGFSNRTHFYKIFEKEYGMTPKEYRKM